MDSFLKQSEYKRILYIVLAVTGILTALCFVKMLMPDREFCFGTDHMQIEGSEAVFRDIALPAGVYTVELMYNVDTDALYHCNAADESVFHGGLLTSGEHLYSGLDRTGYTMWLFESTDSLRVYVDGGNGEGLEVYGLNIYKTNQLWSMALTVIIVISAAISACILWKKYDAEGRIAKSTKEAVFGIIVISFVASLPQLIGVSLCGVDLTYHLQRIEGVRDGLLSGQFPVRLEPKWVMGYGYADAVFYCNSLLYFPALLRILGFGITTVHNVYFIVLNLATAIMAYYCFGKIFRDNHIGLMCSALYTLSIYRLDKIVVLGALGEASALTFMPLILYGLYRIFTENIEEKKYKTSYIPLMAGYTGIVQTHVLTCEITIFLTIVLCIVMIRKFVRKESLFEFVKAAAGTILLSLWYIVPFVDYYISEDLHIQHVSSRSLQNEGANPVQLILHFYETGRNGDEGLMDRLGILPEGVGLVLSLAGILFLIWWISGRLSKGDSVIAFGKVSVVFAAALLFMSLKYFPWDKIQYINSVTESLIGSIQYPHRFWGWGTLLLTAVSGCCLYRYKTENHRKGYYVCVICVLIALTTSSMFYNDYMERDHHRYELYNPEGMGRGYISGAEYLIEGTDANLLTYRAPYGAEGVLVNEYKKGDLSAEFSCMNVSTTESYVELPLLHYKGYRAFASETGEPLRVVKGDNNVVRVMIPAGYSGKVSVRFVSPYYWRISEVISLICWVAVLITVILRIGSKNDRIVLNLSDKNNKI